MPTGESGNTLASANPTGSVTNESTRQSTFRADRFGHVIEWNNPLSYQMLIVRNADGLAAKITDPTSGVTTLGYDLLGNLRYQKNPDNSTRTAAYSSNFNFVTSSTDELNRTSSYGYDSYGNMTSSTDPASYVTSVTYTSRGFPSTLTRPDPDGGGPLNAAVYSFTYDTYSRLTTLTNPDSSTRVYTYDSADNRLTDRDELEHTTTYAYDQLGRTMSVTDRVSGVTSYTYNALGLMTKVTDTLNNATDYEYSNRNWNTKITRPDPDGAGSLSRPESNYTYDDAGNLKTIGLGWITPGNNIEHYYDNAGRRTSTLGPLSGVTTSYGYDAMGRITTVTDDLIHTTSYQYNSRGWLTRIEGHDPDGAGGQTGPITQFGYNVAGERTTITDPRGYVTTYTYNARGLVSTITQPDPDGTGPGWAPLYAYGYDNVGRLKTIDDPLCRVTTYAYNQREWTTSVTEPDPDGAGSLTAPVTSYGYDAAGRVTSITDPLSRVMSFGYDHEGRMTSLTQPDPDGPGSLTSPVWSWVYNLMGSVTSAADPRSNATTFQYDALQRRTSMTQADPDGGGSLSAPVTSYVYNSQTLLSKVTDPIGRDTTYGYDAAGRRTSVKDHLNNQTTLAYNDINLLTSVTSPDPDGAGSQTSSVTTYGYDVWNRLTTITDPLNGSTDFTYDAAGNVLTLDDPLDNTTSWSYDNIGRLTMETNELGYSRSFNYDAASSLTRKADRNGRVIQYDRDELTRLTAEKWYSNGTPTPTIAIATTTQGGQTNEVQRVGFTATMITGGTFTLTFNGATTSAITYNASAATVQSALEALSTVGTGNVAVTKLQNSYSAQEWQLTFQGSKAGTDVVQTSVNSANIQTAGGSPTNIQATDTQGSTNNEVQTVTLSNANGGKFRLAFNGNTTAPLNQTASAADVDSALEGLNTVDQVTVTGNAGGPWTVTFVGTHNNTNVSTINGDASSLTNGSLTRTISYTFDAADQLTSTSDPDSSYAYTYDNIGRVLTVDNNGTSGVPRVILTNAFDAASNRTSLKTSIAGTDDFQNSYTYDNLNRLTRVDQIAQGSASVAEKRVDFAYNAADLFTQIARYKDTDGGSTHEVATSTYTYDALGRLTGLAHKKGGTNLFTPYSWTYDSLSRVGTAHRLPGVGVDPRLGGPVLGNSAPIIDLNATTGFESLGRVTQFTSQDGTTDYSHDKTSQLTGADHSYQTDESYSYDASGNRTMTGYQTGTNNRLLNDGTYSFQYDNEGNRTRKTKISDSTYTEYEWDFRDRLTKVTNRNSSDQITQVVEYKYDVFDRRISRARDATSPFDLADGAIERYVLDDQNGVASLDGGNVILDFVDPDGGGSQSIALSKRYLYGNAIDQILAQEDIAKNISATDRVLWPLCDNLQTVRDLAKQDGTINGHYKYDSFGKVTAGDSSITRYLFTSREVDTSTELQYNRSRWYDAQSGRFTSTDPLSFFAGDSSVFRYAANQSITRTDASGLWSYEAHMKLLMSAFSKNKIFNANQIKQMTDKGKEMDTPWGVPSPNHEHFMLDAIDTNPVKSILMSEDFVNAQLQAAADKTRLAWLLEEAKHRDETAIQRMQMESMMHLAAAFHCIMDSTSPAHVDANGYPVWYGGSNTAKHSGTEFLGIETAKHITKEIYSKCDIMLNDAYNVYRDKLSDVPDIKTKAYFDFPKPADFPLTRVVYSGNGYPYIAFPIPVDP